MPPGRTTRSSSAQPRLAARTEEVRPPGVDDVDRRRCQRQRLGVAGDDARRRAPRRAAGSAARRTSGRCGSTPTTRAPRAARRGRWNPVPQPTSSRVAPSSGCSAAIVGVDDPGPVRGEVLQLVDLRGVPDVRAADHRRLTGPRRPPRPRRPAMPGALGRGRRGRPRRRGRAPRCAAAAERPGLDGGRVDEQRDQLAGTGRPGLADRRQVGLAPDDEGGVGLLAHELDELGAAARGRRARAPRAPPGSPSSTSPGRARRDPSRGGRTRRA